MNYLKYICNGLVLEAKKLRKLERKTTASDFENDYNSLDLQEFFAKYGKDLTYVQLLRLLRRRKHVLNVTHRQTLHKTRTHTIRKESRCVGLARAYFNGYAYYQIERFCYEQPNWEHVSELVANNIFDGKDKRLVMQQFAEWLEQAKEYTRDVAVRKCPYNV